MARKYETKKMTLVDVVSDAWSELQSLADEMREAFDNTPESLQQSSVGEARGEAADALEQLSEPDVPEAFGELGVELHLPVRTPKQQMKLSRSTRRDDAVALLDAAVDALRNVNGEQEDEAEMLADELENLKDEAEAVEFPGMFG